MTQRTTKKAAAAAVALALRPTHSELGASGMYRWSKCPGSRALSRGMPDPQSPYAKEGTRAHEIAARMIADATDTPYDTTWEQLQITTDDVPIIHNLADYVSEVSRSMIAGDALLIENRFHMAALHDDLYGTSDAAILSPSRGLLIVNDLKYGAGIGVEVENNPQLCYYGLGTLLHLEERYGNGVNVKRVRMTITQPRFPHPAGTVRSVTIDATDLLDWIPELLTAVKATEQPNAPLVPGKWCQFCRAKKICPELPNLAMHEAQREFGVLPAIAIAATNDTSSRFDLDWLG